MLRRRPDEQTWSALEYACHVRDVFDTYGARVARILAEDEPVLDSMDRDERPVRDRYNEQDPAVVAEQVADRAAALAAAFESLAPEAWERTAIHPYPEPAPRSLAWMARHVVHEGNHHLLDIGRVLRAARGRS